MLSKPIAKLKNKSQRCFKTAYFAYARDSEFFSLISFFEITCGSNRCAKYARDVHFYHGFREVVDSRPQGINYVYFVRAFMMFLVCLDAGIVISL